MVEAIVEFDYQAQHDDELTIAVGDIVSNIRKNEGGWWEGELDGRRGLFPDNFVREIKKDSKKEVKKESSLAGSKSDLSNGSASPKSEPSLRSTKKGEAFRKRRCKAVFSYAPQNEDELELKIGDVIEVLGEVEEGWWEGTLSGKTGMFPSNFTKELLAEAEDLTPQDDTRSTRTSQSALHTHLPTSKLLPHIQVMIRKGREGEGGRVFSLTEHSKCVCVCVKATLGVQDVKELVVSGWIDSLPCLWKDCGSPAGKRPDKQSQMDRMLFTHPPMVKKVALAVAQETMKAEPENKAKAKELCKVIFPYEAQNEDELSIKEGDIVTVINKDSADTGWWLGELNGKQGVFPDNFVKLFIPEVEKERPKKPPPPAAPTTKQITDKKTEAKRVPPERPESLPHRAEEKGEESKLGEIAKPSFPAALPKKPLPPKNNNSLNRPLSLPPKRPDRPERPAVPNIPCDSPKCDGSGVAADRGSADKSVDVDVEDFDSIVLSTEKLNHPTTSRPRVTDRRPRSQIFTSFSLSSPDLLDSPSPEEERRDKEMGKEEQDSFIPKTLDNSKKMPKAVPVITAPEKSSLPPKPSAPPSSSGSSGASLHQGSAGLRPHSPSVDARVKNEQGTSTLEELRAQLRDLKGTVELMKSQHKQEIKQLVSELDEEKRIRISLQVRRHYTSHKRSPNQLSKPVWRAGVLGLT
ncbi:SH3 domain-containing kinase-binding protein 1-like [Sinocyclocheilus grahami]|uniref:SH3 domain-containing kinase-binding protein 1-like n=1 Tax=Sinocyclocheilus grahami TaxID=75366 RepID=UPI0007ACCF20|nr:PREDICTED: SH3 domain-containing kinase-binding protein 1-like [Sinocyclocheilus grahami]